jgi:hypothetical protein
VSSVKYELGFYIPESDILIVTAVKTSNHTEYCETVLLPALVNTKCIFALKASAENIACICTDRGGDTVSGTIPRSPHIYVSARAECSSHVLQNVTYALIGSLKGQQTSICFML